MIQIFQAAALSEMEIRLGLNRSVTPKAKPGWKPINNLSTTLQSEGGAALPRVGAGCMTAHRCGWARQKHVPAKAEPLAKHSRHDEAMIELRAVQRLVPWVLAGCRQLGGA